MAKALLGSKPDQVVTSDRYSSYEWIDPAWRQICWSHLRRDFQAMIDRGGAGEAIGRRLLRLSKRMFRWWHRLRDGTMRSAAVPERIAARLRREVKAALEDGPRCGCAKTAATCFEILKVEEGLWTFARVEGVEPTNNAAERALRHAVIWRRISGGTDSARWEPVRGADADGGGDLPAAGPQRAGLPDLVLRGAIVGAKRSPLSCRRATADQSRLIPPIPPCERLRRGLGHERISWCKLKHQKILRFMPTGIGSKMTCNDRFAVSSSGGCFTRDPR